MNRNPRQLYSYNLIIVLATTKLYVFTTILYFCYFRSICKHNTKDFLGLKAKGIKYLWYGNEKYKIITISVVKIKKIQKK